MSNQNTAGHKWQLAVAIIATTPAWIVAGYRKNLSMPESAEKCDTSTVNDAGYKNSVPGMRGWSINLNHLWVTSDAALALLRTAYKSGASIYARVLDNQGIALTTALTSGTPYTTAAVGALNQLIPSGTHCRIGTAAVHTDVVLSADALPGDTAIVFASVTPAATLAIGSLVAVGTTLTAPDAASGRSGTVCVLKFDVKIDEKEVFLDLALEGQGAPTDIG